MEGADEADLSLWTGKPPERSNSSPRNMDVDIQTISLRSSGKPSTHFAGTISDHESNTSSEANEIHYIDFFPSSKRSNSVMSTSSRPSNAHRAKRPKQRESTDIRVIVPTITDYGRQTYEYLPGHFSVNEVLAEPQSKQYVVRLDSGEVQILKEQDLVDLDNGDEALDTYRTTDEHTRSRQRSRKPGASEMIDWSLLNVSDVGSEDEELLSQNRYESRNFAADATGDDASENDDVDDEDSDEDELESFGPKRRAVRKHQKGRRSSRLAGGRQVTDYREQPIDLLDSDDDEPQRSRRVKAFARRTNGSPQLPDVATRRSERTRTKGAKSMRERQEDEISSHSEEEAGPKILTQKEVFPRFSEDDLFRQRHRQDCEVCNHEGYSSHKGHLVYCQGCTSCYHKGCLGPRGSRDHLVTKVGEEYFVLQCRRCIGIAHNKDSLAPHQGHCIACDESGINSEPFKDRLTTRQEQLQREENGGQDPIVVVSSSRIDNIHNLLFRCSTCYRGWHMHHLPSRATAQSQLEDEENEALTKEEVAQRRFDMYHRSWRCKDCIENKQTVDAIIAWRPIDQEGYIPGMPVDMVEEVQKEYLLKWGSQSHLRATWMPGSWVWSATAGAMRIAFMKKPENALPKMTTKDAIPEDFLRIDIVFDVKYNSVVRNSSKEIDFARIKEVETAYVKYKGLGYEDAIWEVPPVYTDVERFNDFKTAYEDYVIKVYMSIPPQSTLRRRLTEIRNHDFDHWSKKQQPSILSGGSLMQYQLEGMNWLYYQWFRSQNAILADEMGLGKTIQIIAFFTALIQDHKCWPFLIVVPNSTCPNWRREIKKWAPSIRAVTYYGSQKARSITSNWELFPKDKTQDSEASHKKARSEVKDIKAHIVITSYESIVEETTRKSLMRVPWQGLIVDEGQRLKNDKNLIYEALGKFRFPFKVLLTGTPLQNNPRELFNLIQFLDKSHNATELEAKYSELTAEKVPELHELLRPFFLRRTKVQVLTFLPPMAQIIVPVTMSTVQKKVYKSILARNPLLMKSIFSRERIAAKDRANLNNMLMQLRKTLCHPFVYSREIEERTPDNEIAHRNLVEASAKLRLLHIMLPKLQERGHRVLLFSQFLDNLDIVEDFLDGLGMLHRRLDGTINALEKQKRIDDFNAPNSPYFAFLLSTRAGGVGINLATADTVIILDPDFNPHQDIQALSRAHRIGQQNKVLVFQLMTRNSAEEKIMQIGKKKMALDHVLIERMDQEDDAGENLESILRYGAESLFEDTEEHDIVYDSASVDKLLDRSQVESTKTSDDKSAESQFSFARIWANENATFEDTLQDANETGISTPDPGIWDKILAERERAYQEELLRKEEALGRGKRKREKIDYHDRGFNRSSKAGAGEDSTDGEFEAAEPEGSEKVSSDGEESELEKMPRIRARPFRRIKVPLGTAPHFNGDGPATYIPVGGMPPEHVCGACKEKHPMGWCRLKLAGVEHCGLCGLAHLGYGRTCPHLNSEKHIDTLLLTLKESTESRESVDEASKYLRLIRSDLIAQRRIADKKEAEAAMRARYGQPVAFNPRVPPAPNGPVPSSFAFNRNGF